MRHLDKILIVIGALGVAVFGTQMLMYEKFYVDLLNQTSRLMKSFGWHEGTELMLPILQAYRWAWYLPNLLTLVFLMIALAGFLLLY